MSRLADFITASCWLLLVTSGVTSLSAADVEVRLTDGRTLRGSVIESQTSKDRLALELRASGITIRRTLTRNQIADCKIIPAIKLKTDSAAAPRPASEKRDAVPDSDANLVALPLSQLLVKADPISTFGKMDWDSLRVTLRGVNELGDPVPLFGTLNVTLRGQQRVSPESKFVRHPFVTEANFGSRFLSAPLNSYAYQHPYVTSPNPTVDLAKWTRSIGVESQGGTLDSAVDERVRLSNTWGPTGYWQDTRVGSRQDGRRAESRGVEGHDSVLVLRLQRPLPDHDVWAGTFGEVSVELLMPGVGVFAANASDIVLSHQHALRRERLDRDGSRFYPDESTTHEPQTSRSRQRFTWPGGVSGPERGILPIQP